MGFHLGKVDVSYNYPKLLLKSMMASPRKSTGLSPKSIPANEVVVPALLAAVLRQHSQFKFLP